MAITFSSTSYLTCGGTFANYTACTVSVWCNITAYGTVASSGFFSNRICGSDDNWEIRVCTDYSSGAFKFSNELFSSTNQTPVISTTTPALGTWYHLACTISNGAAKNSIANMYVNGAIEGTTTYPAAADTPSSTAFGIGNRPGATSGQCFNGVLDDLRVYNRVLNAAEIATIYHAQGSDHIWFGLQNKWIMNEGAVGAAVGTAINATGSTFNATPTNSPAYSASFLKWRGRH